MQIFRNVYLFGGEDYSMSGTCWPHGDCCCYVIDTGRGLMVFDPGFAETMPEKIEAMRYWGLDPDDVRYVFVTHGHLDHCTGALFFQERGAMVVASKLTADIMERGNADGEDRLAFWAFRMADPCPEFVPCRADIVTPPDDIREFLGIPVKSIHTEGPGHHHALGPRGVSLFLVEFGGRNLLFSGDHILFGRYGKISWPDPADRPLFDSLRSERIDAILGGHDLIHWRPWPRPVESCQPDLPA